MNHHIVVPFTREDCRRACDAGVERNLEGLIRNHKPAYGTDQDRYGFQFNIDGCFGELGLAKHLRREAEWIACAYGGWHPATDVGELQVRCTPYHNGHLLLHHPRDADTDPFVFATYSLRREPVVLLHGWLLAKDGKRPEYWRENAPGDKRDPCFWVPQSALHPMATLPVTEMLPDWMR